MSSERPTPTLEEITAFLENHGLPDALRGPLEAFVLDYAERGVTVMQPELTSLPTLYADPDDGPTHLPDPPGFDEEDQVSTERMLEGGTTLVRRGLLGQGGMGDVYRAFEPSLNRVLAMKVLHEKYRENRRVRAQFLVEASITAQLTHPGIPPIHAVGEHHRRPCFTMKEVQGRTLSSILRQVHGVDPADDDLGDWSEARRLSVFNKVCNAVAYAHSRGVVHCDLKPANIMVGAFGEVLVMDWGVARLVEPAGGPTTAAPVSIHGELPMQGAIAGTPAYMPPEQAAGDDDLMGPAADVFALGVILFELLTGELPFEAPNSLMRIAEVMQGNIRELTVPSGSIVDDALRDIINRALSPLPGGRHPHAAALSEDITRWRDGAQRRERALQSVREARERLPEVAELRARASVCRTDAAEATQTARRWAREDEASALERSASLSELDVIQKLNAALADAPELDEAHTLLAAIYRRKHAEAERARDWSEAARQEVLLAAHDLGEHASYIAGMGALTLQTQPAASVDLFRYIEHGRRLVPDRIDPATTTPIADLALEVGSYLLELRAEGCSTVRLPLHVRRTGGIAPAPDGADPTIVLPPLGAVKDDEVYVPAGWFRQGGDAQAPGGGPGTRVWVDGFVIQRLPVSWLEVSAFLASPEGREARSGAVRGGTLALFRADWPAAGLSYDAAQAYARWRSERDGVAWSLPSELQWEKAARGVDGRWYPWGDVLHETFAHVRSGAAIPSLPRKRTHLVDVSPYGVVGMAGNVREWCSDPFDAESDTPLQAVRGGSFLTQARFARCAARDGLDGRLGYPDVGLRLVRPLEGTS